MHIFNKTSYDPFIDYVKGLCVICVILQHNLPHQILDAVFFHFTGAMAVPIFLLIQVFHATRFFNSEKFSFESYYSLSKLLKRVVLPFLLLLFAQLLVFSLTGNFTYELLKSMIIQGGYGPGAYYFWIYLQFWVLLPPMLMLFKRIGLKKFFLFCLLGSVIMQVICSYLAIPIPLYRLLCCRYFFLIFLGVYLYHGKDNISIITYMFAVAGFLFLAVRSYTNIDLEPFFFHSGSEFWPSWTRFDFPTYLYVTFLLLPLLKYIYICIANFAKLHTYIHTYIPAVACLTKYF